MSVFVKLVEKYGKRKNLIQNIAVLNVNHKANRKE